MPPLLLAITAISFTASAMPLITHGGGPAHPRSQKCYVIAEKKGKTKGDFAIDRMDDMKKQVKAGSPDASSLVISVTLPDDDEDVRAAQGREPSHPRRGRHPQGLDHGLARALKPEVQLQQQHLPLAVR